MESFHANFPSFEKQMQKQADREKEMELAFCKNMFFLKYPGINWEDLSSQKKGVYTDDGCLHYLHKPTKKIYSWNFLKSHWMEHQGYYQDSLRNKLFDENEFSKTIQ